MKSYEVIDNFLEKEYFEELVNIFINKDRSESPTKHQERADMSVKERAAALPWFFQTDIMIPEWNKDWLAENKLFYMTHVFYEKNAPRSYFYDKLHPFLEKLDARCLIRLKANLFPKAETLHEHPMHIDYEFPHTGAVLSLNTCDGYTKLHDGTKIESVANRLLLFDGSKEHSPTNTTNATVRVNINVNFIKVQEQI